MKANIKGAEFLIKETPCQEIFTLENISEEQKMIRDTTKEFIEKEILPNKERFEKKDYQFTVECMNKIAELGLLGTAVPEEYGGLGMSFTTTLLVCDYISGATGSLGTAFGAHTGIGTLPILYYGTEEQKKKYLPKLTSGEWYGAYCLTEPGAGSDANSGKTKAVLSDDGKFYKITGQKMWISNAGFAELFIVFARIEDDKNITAFIIEKSQANGMTLGEEEHKLGIRSSSTRQVFFDNTEVPVENMLGERNQGFKIALNVLNVGRIKLGIASLDAQRIVLKNSINYAKERKQFGTEIANFGAIQSKIADIAMELFVGESACYRVGGDIQNAIENKVESGMNHQEAELKGVEEFAIEASILKVYLSEVSQKTSDEGIQIFGGMGFSEDTPMESFWRDARITRIYEGTNEINRLLIVGMMIKRAMKGEVDLMNPAMKVGEELMGIPSFDVPDFSELFAEEKLILANLKKIFLMIAGKAVQKFGMELEKQQELLLNASDVAIEVFIAESGILRAEKIANEKGKENAEIEIAIAKLKLYKAVEKINAKAKEAIISFTDSDEQRVMLSGLKRFTKYYNYPNVIELSRKVAHYYVNKNE
ncbi:MAG: acyl-CoA dehydrogenase family protein [Flavobacteriales bacterium]|nr:acyl-CoA dehydrogenase family protein [Flavobacteriales bacterium]